MMATTHALFGALLGAVASLAAPELAPVTIAAGVAGGLFPDLDLALPGVHRKTLHFPVYYALAAIPAVALASLAPTARSLAVAVFLAAAAAHAASDALGGGLELRPWEAASDRGVYDHFHGRWIRPRRWIRYDGAPEDLLLAAALAAPGVGYDPRSQAVVLALLAVSVVYATLRKRLVDVGERLADRLPPGVRARLPISV